MNEICPVCNGLINLEPVCPNCGRTMENGGRLQDFDGPYSPYQDPGLIPAPVGLAAGDQCTHLYYCPNCRHDARIAVSTVPV